MGFTPAAGAFSAAETGAPHERLRWFCVAHRAGRGCGIVGDAAQPGRGGHADCGNVDLDDAAGSRCDAARIGAKAHSQGGECLSGDGRNEVAQPAVKGLPQRRQPGQPEAGAESGNGVVAEPERCGGNWSMADTSQPGPQGGEEPGSPHQWNRPAASGSTSERGCLPLFPPGPGDRDTWAAVMASNPDRAPSFARRDVIAAAVNLAATLSPDEAEAIEPALRSIPRGAGMGAVVSQAPALVDQAQTLTGLRNLADGLALRTRALRLLGNGVCPLAAAHAWRSLASAHGLWPVDLATARRDCGSDSDGDGVVT